ncbi:hypothetical protein [Delftia lacustris]|nr:hypothetical protein [Delftia lacustris]
MMYRIHYTLSDGSEDSFVVSGGSIDGIRDRAEEELAKRGGADPWSEELG